MTFKDHFSGQSKDYRQFRPSYPPALYQHLSDLAAGHDLAWDCATGTGQAARGLAPYFRRVVASDASAQQIRYCSGPENIAFSHATAEQSGLANGSVDLITVAQALHWFNFKAFFVEVRRVLKPGGLLVCWSYNLLRIGGQIDGVLQDFNENIIGPYWPVERAHVREGYRSIDFPFQAVALPDFAMSVEWDLDQLTGYLGTWSSVVRYREEKGCEPLQIVLPQLRELWGNSQDVKKIIWPLTFRAGRC